MMVVPIIALLDKLEPGGSIPEIKSLDYRHLLQQPNRTIDGCQIAFVFRQSGENLFDTDGMCLPAKEIQNRLPRAGNFVRLASQSFGEMRKEWMMTSM